MASAKQGSQTKLDILPRDATRWCDGAPLLPLPLFAMDEIHQTADSLLRHLPHPGYQHLSCRRVYVNDGLGGTAVYRSTIPALQHWHKLQDRRSILTLLTGYPIRRAYTAKIKMQLQPVGLRRLCDLPRGSAPLI